NTGGPEFNRTLALTHTHFSRLLGHRQIRENPDPHAALALHLAGDRAASRFDLASGDALWLGCLQGILAEHQIGAALGNAMDTALVSLAELGLLRLQHNELTSYARSRSPRSRRGSRSLRCPPSLPSVARRSCAVGSCSSTSPLNTQTLMPMMPYVVSASAVP